MCCCTRPRNCNGLQMGSTCSKNVRISDITIVEYSVKSCHNKYGQTVPWSLKRNTVSIRDIPKKEKGQVSLYKSQASRNSETFEMFCSNDVANNIMLQIHGYMYPSRLVIMKKELLSFSCHCSWFIEICLKLLSNCFFRIFLDCNIISSFSCLLFMTYWYT